MVSMHEFSKKKKVERIKAKDKTLGRLKGERTRGKEQTRYK